MLESHNTCLFEWVVSKIAGVPMYSLTLRQLKVELEI